MLSSQRAMLQLLDELAEICDEAGVRYFLDGGTLLGACRNEGFLPWDDDVDIALPYDEWLKLREACSDSLPPNRALVSIEDFATQSHLSAHYMALDATCLHPRQTLHDDKAGMIIDVVLLDPIADGDESWEGYKRTLAILSDLVNYSSNSSARHDVEVGELQEAFEFVDSFGLKAAVEKYYEQLKSYFSAEGEYYVLRWAGHPARFKRAWFKTHRMVSFEGKSYRCPGATYEYLVANYGEEWHEIPEDVSPTRHNAATSVDIPYNEALEYFRPEMSREELRQESRRRKLSTLALSKTRNDIRLADNKIRGEKIRNELNRYLLANRADFDSALAAKDGAHLAILLKDYLDFQVASSVIGRPDFYAIFPYYHSYLLEMPSDVFLAGLYALMGTRRICFASRLLDLWELEGKELTPGMVDVKAAIDLYNQANVSVQVGHHAKALMQIKQANDSLPGVPAFHALELRLLGLRMEAKPTGKNIDAVRVYAQDCLAAFPDDGVFIKYLADCLRLQGYRDFAVDLYIEAAERTRDGFVLFDIAQRVGYYPSWMREADWGKRFGIPDWDNQLKAPLVPVVEDACYKGPNPIMRIDRGADEAWPASDEVQRYLFELLCRLCDFCDANGIAYMLYRRLSKCFFKYGKLPDHMDYFTILMSGDQLLLLVKKLNADMPKGCFIQYMGNSVNVLDRTVRFCGADFALADSNSVDIGKTQAFLGVCIRPLEVNEYPAKIQDSIDAWIASAKKIRSDSDDPVAPADLQKLGKATFKKALSYSEKQGGDSYRFNSAVLKVPDCYLQNVARGRFLGHWFTLPGMADSWIERGKDISLPQDSYSFKPGQVAVRTGLVDPFEKSDRLQRYLYDLLCELCDICEGNGIGYFLNRSVSKSLFRYGRLPDVMAQYAILVPASQMRALVGALECTLPESRMFEYMGNSAFRGDRAIRYCGTDSLLLDMDAQYCNERFSNLGVFAWPLELRIYDGQTESQLRAWNAMALAMNGGAAEDGLTSTLVSAAAQNSNAATDWGQSLFDEVMALSVEGRGSCWRTSGKAYGVDSAVIDGGTALVSFGERTFRMPVLLDEWLFHGAVFAEPSSSLKLQDSQVASIDISYDQMRKLINFEEEYFASKRSIETEVEAIRLLTDNFLRNFALVKEAVALKEIAIGLLSRKSEILACFDAHNVRRLKVLLGDYLALACTCDDINRLNFDQEIFDALLYTRKAIAKSRKKKRAKAATPRVI